MAPGASRAAGRDTISLAGQVHLELPREARDKIDTDCSQRVAQAFQPVQAQAKACGYRK